MNAGSLSMAPLLWFGLVLVMIPLLLRLLKRTRLGGAAAAGVLRSVAVLPLSNSQRILTIEVGEGEQRVWLVLGVTAHSITTLHTLAPQGPTPAAGPLPPLVPAPLAASFAQLMAGLRPKNKGPHDA